MCILRVKIRLERKKRTISCLSWKVDVSAQQMCHSQKRGGNIKFRKQMKKNCQPSFQQLLLCRHHYCIRNSEHVLSVRLGLCLVTHHLSNIFVCKTVTLRRSLARGPHVKIYSGSSLSTLSRGISMIWCVRPQVLFESINHGRMRRRHNGIITQYWSGISVRALSRPHTHTNPPGLRLWWWEASLWLCVRAWLRNWSNNKACFCAAPFKPRSFA
jgi:hypothetical protein